MSTEITDEVIRAIEKDQSEAARELEEIVAKLYPENQMLSDDANSAISGSDKLKLIKHLADKRFKNRTKTRSLVGGPQRLIDGNTIHIPKNVWFIGTANRDESTFEITDKVYDRAQVLNFNNRAAGKKNTGDVPRVFLTYGELNKMFTKAANSPGFMFKAEESELLKKIENILKQSFRISYGNRIQDQMNVFVPVYVAAGFPGMKMDEPSKRNRLINEAIDYQLTNKVLRKLEYEEISKEAAHRVGNQLRIVAASFWEWYSMVNDGEVDG